MMKTVVFQGDSITACGRLKYDVNVMGEGYARIKADITKRVAKKYQLSFVPLQKK